MLLTEQIESQNPTLPFVEAIERLRMRNEQEQLIVPQSRQTFAAIADAVEELVALAKPMEFEISAGIDRLVVSGNERTLTIVRTPGLALDSRMRNPRGMFCSLILFFAHRKDDQTSQLCSSLRVYSDGFCSDGDVHWILNDGKEGTIAFVANLMAEYLINMQFYWPEDDQFTHDLSALPVVANQTDADAVSRCVGFECSVPHWQGKHQHEL